jgi:5-methylcytosine-specific restriction endonuclease McrA
MACKREWMKDHLSGLFRGEKGPNWKGGKVKYYGPNWRHQRTKARERDGYKCRHCGVSQKSLGRRLDVHHIKPFRSFGYIFGQNDNYKIANELSNLISLCPNCHKAVENNEFPIQPNLL